jgi:hypothetical protein
MQTEAEKETVRQQTEQEFTRMEAELAATQPGVLDVLRVYGDCEAALRQADAYFAALNPVPDFSTTNTSG